MNLRIHAALKKEVISQMLISLPFLSNILETQIFVEKLFDAVNTKSYLPPPEQPSSGSLKSDFFQHQEKETKKEEVVPVVWFCIFVLPF